MKLTILLVEDDDAMRDALVRLLRSEGATVVAATTAAHVPHAQYDVAVLDIDLPGTDGVTLGERLLAQRTVPRVLFHTAATNVDVLRRAAASGTVVRKGATQELLQALAEQSAKQSCVD